ncbi:hypothetical protein PV08_07777 [Exophiala spinifera]|uniref:Glycosyl transferase family 25 domain-containing protein n=1 Tax=Exophiala spinifera TaxID=91928 RepID=A0A0D2B8L1_9EURO|nr:uncharacterized protein PV08_07777 [Exophiala spinifera]KIW14990.1 hypothetical protein PV08_07777 [Exophiala spinifera]
MGSLLQTTQSWSSTKATRKYMLFGLLLVVAFTLHLTVSHVKRGSEDFKLSMPSMPSPPKLGRFSTQRDNLGDIYNRTLGFQKVFVMNLPERSDKADTMLLQAELTNFTLEFVDGVLGATVSPKALPLTFEHDAGTIGCWRAHMNIWRKMVEENIETALVLEDDADWDVSIQAQFVELARGSRFLLDTGSATPESPYGDGWSLLWVGHCSSEANKTDPRRWVIPHDPTVPPRGSRWHFAGHNMSRWADGPNPDPQTRVVYVQEFAFCTSGYAVTRRAAQMMLYKLGMVPFSASVDGGMGNLCKDTSLKDFRCIAPFPRLIGKSTPPGPVDRASDIQTQNSNSTTIRWKPESENVMFSVRQNLLALLNGETTFKSYFPNPSGDELTMEQITAFRGHPEYMDQPPPLLQG